MPNCLADNITGHSCDPYVFLRDRPSVFVLYCEHFSETTPLVKRVPGSVPVTSSITPFTLQPVSSRFS